VYYQIYNTATGETYSTHTDYRSALSILDECNNPHYYNMHQQVYAIREVDEKEHPLFGEPEFEAVEQEMLEEAGDYNPEGEWVELFEGTMAALDNLTIIKQK
jgi:hypothetical protein